jgi:hypothetical protein
MNEIDLKNLAHRTAILMRELPQYRAILDVIAGALFALFRAKRLAYKHREGQLSDEYLQNLIMRLERMAKGSLPQKHGWLAGFYFNSSIQRTAASGEQLAGILRRLNRRAKHQRNGLNTPSASPALEQLRKEVNHFKHDETGLERGRNITPELAVMALSEIVHALETYKEPLKAMQPQSRSRSSRNT